MDSLDAIRQFYAKFVVMHAGSKDENLIAAFSSVERERFLSKGPWSLATGAGYITTPSDEPRFVYCDCAIALAADRHINNGQPSLHARCLGACAPTPGETVLHVGAGTGYYTAILSFLVGLTGQVIAYEIYADLAERARENLKDLPNVTVKNVTASEGVLPPADVVYVNAGATHPPAVWLDALKTGGRLIFPLTGSKNFGVMLLVTRKDQDSYAARVVIPAGFIGCVGARDDAAAASLDQVLQSWPMTSTKSLRRGTEPDTTACCIGNGWWLSTTDPA